MPVVNPGIRRLLASAIQRLLNGASFSAPLTHSAIPTRAASGTTATFTRATTATVTNNDGYLVTALAGEARFEGARRVRNLIAGSSEDLANASWSSILVTAPTPTTVLATAGAGAHHRFNAGPAAVAGNTYVLQAKLTAGTARYAVLGDRGDAVYRSVTFDLQTGTKGAEHNATGTMEDLGGGQYLCTAKFVRTNGGTALYLAVGITDSNSSYIESGFVAAGTETIIAEEIQLEDITGRADQTTPSDYVSVGVLSAPYHGAGVDGVKYFDTDLSGNPIAASINTGYVAEGARTNLFKYSNTFSSLGSNGPLTVAQNAVGPNGASNYAWTLTDDSASVTEDFYNDVTLTAAEYTQQIKVKKTTGAQTAYPVLHCTNYAGTLTARCTIDTTNGIATVWTAATGFTVQASSARCRSQNADFWIVELTFLGTAAAGWYVVLAPAGTTNPVQSTGILDVSAQGSHVFCDAQLELGSFASSYIPTTTIAVARNADVLTYSSAGNIDGTKGWCYCESTFATTIPTTTTLIAVSFGPAQFPIYHHNNNVNAAFDGTNLVLGRAWSDTTTHKLGSTWGGSSVTIANNGQTDTGSFDGNMGSTSIGVGSDGTTGLFGNIGPIYIGQRQLSASEMQAITA